MKKCCIIIGELEINKKFLIPIFLSLIQTIIAIIELFYPEKSKNHIFESTTIGLGELAIIIIPHIKFFSASNKNEKAKCECSKKFCLHYFILLILYGIKCNLLYIGYSNILGNEHSIFEIQINDLSTKQSIEIIIITIISKFMLKYKYFIHHYLSIMFFFLSSVGFDLILGNFSNYFSGLSWKEISCIVMGFLIEGIYLCYIKYMIDIHYHQYWNIISTIGIMVLMINIITIISYIIIGNKSSLPDFIKYFWVYFHSVPEKIIASKFIVNFVLQFIINGLEILIIFYLSPEYIIMSQFLCIFVFLIIKLINRTIILQYKYQYCFLIFHAIQANSLMIYFESLELNFCNLNKNTKRNIKSRENDDLIERIDSFNDEGFEVKEGYIFQNSINDSCEKDNIKIELNQIKIFKDNK